MAKKKKKPYTGPIKLTRNQWRTIVEGLEGVQGAVDGLFAELGRKRAAHWGIINDGLCAKDRARAIVAEVQSAGT